MQVKKYMSDFAGKPLSVEIGRMAGQANGSCFVQYGDTAVLVTATMAKKPKDADYFPLSVDYEERYFAAGKIKGSKWIKRETRPSEEAILTARLIDRALRPRFNQNMRNDVQIVAMVLSFDGINDPDMVALFGASIALMISDIPFNGPVAGVRVGRVNNELIVNPSYEQRIASDFDIVTAGTDSKINMIEAGARIVSEKDMVKAIKHGFDEMQTLIDPQKKIAIDISAKKTSLTTYVPDETLVKVVSDFTRPKLEKVLYTPHKQEYVEGLSRIKTELAGYLTEQFKDHPDLKQKLKEADILFEEEINDIVHDNILKHEKRPDGRKIDELRLITSEIGVLTSHGSALFNRGSTQALSILTLAAPGMEQWVETMEIALTKKRFMHHYQFPPFSVGEVGRMGLGRREIGHGALAERALEPIVPERDQFPYTIRVVSEILSSNGSSSMASVCGSSLALMDGGVPVKAAAAGIAMGLMFDQKDSSKFKVLTDIQGPEDHHGDMDLKVAGTKDGVTAMQMDVKIEGIDEAILTKALEQAKKARLEILDVMNKTIKEHRSELSKLAPRVQTMKIDPEKIRIVIGPQGKMINEIIDKTGVEIDIEQDGTVFITATKAESMDEAVRWIDSLTHEVKVGEEFTGKVVKIMDFGAFVELLPGQDGMVHVSEISYEHIKKPSDVLKIGQSVKVRVKNIDDYGRINLTMKLKRDER